MIEASQGQPARFYRNEPRAGGAANGWIGFELEGSRGNRDGWGATVSVRLRGGPTLTRELEPGNGYASQSDGRLHFGLGPAPVVESITVRWPGGRRQELAGLALGRYHRVREP